MMSFTRTFDRDRAYTAPRGWGAWTPGSLMRHLREGPSTPSVNALRPYPYFSFRERIKQAWDVLTYRADALYWKEPKESNDL